MAHFFGQQLNNNHVFNGSCFSFNKDTWICAGRLVRKSLFCRIPFTQLITLESVSNPRLSESSGYLVRSGSLCSKRFSPPSLNDSVSYSTDSPETDWKRISLSFPIPRNSTLK